MIGDEYTGDHPAGFGPYGSSLPGDGQNYCEPTWR